MSSEVSTKTAASVTFQLTEKVFKEVSWTGVWTEGLMWEFAKFLSNADLSLFSQINHRARNIVQKEAARRALAVTSCLTPLKIVSLGPVVTLQSTKERTFKDPLALTADDRLGVCHYKNNAWITTFTEGMHKAQVLNKAIAIPGSCLSSFGNLVLAKETDPKSLCDSLVVYNTKERREEARYEIASRISRASHRHLFGAIVISPTQFLTCSTELPVDDDHFLHYKKAASSVVALWNREAAGLKLTGEYYFDHFSMYPPIDRPMYNNVSQFSRSGKWAILNSIRPLDSYISNTEGIISWQHSISCLAVYNYETGVSHVFKELNSALVNENRLYVATNDGSLTAYDTTLNELRSGEWTTKVREEQRLLAVNRNYVVLEQVTERNPSSEENKILGLDTTSKGVFEKKILSRNLTILDAMSGNKVAHYPVIQTSAGLRDGESLSRDHFELFVLFDHAIGWAEQRTSFGKLYFYDNYHPTFSLARLDLKKPVLKIMLAINNIVRDVKLLRGQDLVFHCETKQFISQRRFPAHSQDSLVYFDVADYFDDRPCWRKARAEPVVAVVPSTGTAPAARTSSTSSSSTSTTSCSYSGLDSHSDHKHLN